ncbi:heavy-metal-associated domain-containing protein [Tsukamurella paurometabola]|uniref:Copper chaperone CopZ n=1 Tax=Tsukamurella paurometabola TaxID=2061 RepID=A0A3P8L504_TSUPA|nr:cation transporter [Tsukamurella paurometabola]MBS4102942.1 heavy-metal-associated domain-containing protein [Tsukamurella paurometabola]UEA85201.1 cation transporter [Tsukamurella paurometabola]VDR37811.1 Copper chaperone CopZ [Tsukamurella paurometabola]
MAVETTYTVTGMTCGHCASSVREEISELGGVTGVEVNVETGAVTVASEAELARDAVEAAVKEAGYTLV